MRAGDLVRWRRVLFRAPAPVGIALTNIDKTSGKRTVWWSIQWSNGKAEIVNERNLTVIS
jgi:hypothetical protein